MHGSCVRDNISLLAGEDAPVARIEVVGAITEVFYETERTAAVGEEHEPAGSGIGERHGLAAEVGEGLVDVDVGFGK